MSLTYIIAPSDVYRFPPYHVYREHILPVSCERRRYLQTSDLALLSNRNWQARNSRETALNLWVTVWDTLDNVWLAVNGKRFEDAVSQLRVLRGMIGEEDYAA